MAENGNEVLFYFEISHETRPKVSFFAVLIFIMILSIWKQEKRGK